MEKMQMLAGAWLPILVSAVAAWFWGFLSWSVLGLHKKDFAGVPFEDELMSYLRGKGLKPGRYFFPHMAECDKRSPEFMEKWKKGPTGLVQVWPEVNMGRNMILTFLVNLAVSVVVAYLGVMTLDKGASFLKVFQVLGTAGVLGYSFAFLPNAIWFCNGVRATAMTVFDGVVMGLAVGAIFGALWP